MSKPFQHVAIIDDDPVSLFLTTTVFNREQLANVTTQFNTAQSALNYLHNNLHDLSKLPDLILVDSNMPGMGGLQFLHELFKVNFPASHNLTICTISADLNIDLRVLQSVCVVKKHFVKPVTRSDLSALVKALSFKKEASVEQ